MAVVHVEDQAVIREVVQRALEMHGFAVVSVGGVQAAKLALAERSDLTGALLDIRLRDGSGVELYEWITLHRPNLTGRVAFVTGSADVNVFASLKAAGCKILRKPFEIAELVRVVADWEGAADAGLR